MSKSWEIFFQKSRFLDSDVQILEDFFKNHAFGILMSKSWKIFSKIKFVGFWCPNPGRFFQKSRCLDSDVQILEDFFQKSTKSEFWCPNPGIFFQKSTNSEFWCPTPGRFLQTSTKSGFWCPNPGIFFQKSTKSGFWCPNSGVLAQTNPSKAVSWPNWWSWVSTQDAPRRHPQASRAPRRLQQVLDSKSDASLS